MNKSYGPKWFNPHVSSRDSWDSYWHFCSAHFGGKSYISLIQKPLALAGVSWTCCIVSEDSTCPEPLFSLLLPLLSRRDMCVTDMLTRRHHWDTELYAGHQDASQCPPHFNLVRKSHNSGHYTGDVAHWDSLTEILSLEIQQPFLICEFINYSWGWKSKMEWQ